MEPMDASGTKAQGATEYIITYSWALAIVAIVIAAAVYYVNFSSAAQATQCTLNGYISSTLACTDVGVATNSISQQTTAYIYLSNTGRYPLANAVVTANVQGVGSPLATCTPAIANPGTVFFCTLSLSGSYKTSQRINGNLTISIGDCGLSTTYNPLISSCINPVNEIITGQFSTQVLPSISITTTTVVQLSTSSSTQVSSSVSTTSTATIPTIPVVVGASTSTSILYCSCGAEYCFGPGFTTCQCPSQCADFVFGKCGPNGERESTCCSVSSSSCAS